MMGANRPLRFYCFSPPVMLATFFIEICLLLYALVRYKLSIVSRLAIALLFFLALFQLAEFSVCGGFGVSVNTWSRVGFIAITFLPPLGLHMLQVITARGWRALKWIAYFNAFIWIGMFAFSQRTFANHICAGNYVIFQLNPSLDRYYYFYYYGWLLITMGMAIYFAAMSKKIIREVCLLIFAGYAIFLLPTTVVNTLDPETTNGVPSIMCGFAVLFAFVIVFGILPRSGSKKLTNHKNSLKPKK